MRYVALLVAPWLALSSPLQAQSTDEPPPSARQAGTTGIEIVSGLEFEELELDDGQEIEKITVPLTARLTTGRVRVSAQLPYVRVSGPGNVVVPSGPLGLPILAGPAGPAEVRTREGIGDARVNVAYDLGVPGANVALNTGAKLPTASVEKGLGTGEVDYWVGAEASTTVGGVTPFAGVSYTMMGESELFELQDTVSGQAGAALRLGKSTSAHIGYSYSEGTSDLLRSEQRLFGGMNTVVGERVSLGFYGSAGVSGPADIGAGVSLGIGLN